MTAFRLNDDEQVILRRSELSHAAKLLYVVGIRSRMDFKTGIVGKVRRVSYQAFHEDIEYLPPKGSTRGSGDFSVAAIRALLDELVRAGLIRRLPNDHRLIFLECLLADREDAPKKMNNRSATNKSNSKNDSTKSSDGNALQGDEHIKSDVSSCGMNNIPPVSGKPICISKAAALLTVPVDNSFALLFVEIVEWLKAAEKRRGKIVSVASGDSNVAGWVRHKVSRENLTTAHAMAVADRERQNNPSPINAAFLNIFVQRVIGKEKPWFVTWSGIVAEGELRGIRRLEGESGPAFKQRVFAAAGIDEEEARKWQA